MLIWYVAAGSAIGGSVRYLVSAAIPQRTDTAFPFGTLIVNVTGAVVLGFIVRYASATQTLSPEMRALLTMGICGGYTTFSTFSLETMILLERGRYDLAAAYIVLSVALSIGAIVAGGMLGQALASR